MWDIRFYEDQRGKSPVLDFLNKLSASDRAKVNNALRLLEEFGSMLSMPHARHMEGRLWELRSGSNRLFYFLYMDNLFVIVHGFRKRTNKTPEKEINTAQRRMKRLLEELE